ncbi:MAG TPA: serine hydrolase [Candidatus Paceibacterota bacterium]
MEPSSEQRKPLAFRMIKTDVHGEPTTGTYVKWGLVLVFFGVSAMSFVTQGVLAFKDVVFNADSGNRVAGIQEQAGGRAASQIGQNNTEQEPRGSDDSGSSRAGFHHNYTITNQTVMARLSGQAYLAADLETGEIILERNEGLVAPIASVSKLMTGLIAHQQMDMQKIAIVSRDSYNTYGAQGKLNIGEKIRLYDLMYPLLMESSNDAAEVIADAFPQGHAAFLNEMNKKARELGMTDTYFEDPSGLNPKNVSSIRDLMILGRHIYQKAPTLYDMTRVRQYSILKHTWVNANRFLNYDSFMGGKNGFIDEAKKTTVSLFDVTMAKGGKRPVVIVILKSDDREGDAVKIMDFLKKNAVFEPSVN